MKGPPRRPALLGTALLALAAAAAPLAAQASASDSATAEARRLLAQANGAVERGDTASAVADAEHATEIAPDLAEAHFLFGLLLARTSSSGLGDFSRRHDASAELDEALRLDADNPRFLIEVARLRLKAPILRLGAERLFRRALAAAHARGDPEAAAEVGAEIGNIYFRRYQALAHRRMILGTMQTFDWESAMRDPHYTKDLLLDYSTPVADLGETDHDKAELDFRQAIKEDSASEDANAGLLALLAEAGRDEEYVDAAENFARAAPGSARAQLYLGLGLWRAHRNAEADTAFRRALAGLTPAERRPLEDLSTVLRAQDAVAYQQLPDSARHDYERAYWWLTEPLRLTSEDEYRLEHLARVAYADLLFSAPDLRLRGWQTDRGQLYIRYGPPTIVATFAPDPNQRGSDPGEQGMMTTVWYYPDRNLRFVFFGPPTYNYERLAGDFGSYAENVRYGEPVTYDNVPLAKTMDSIPVQTAEFRPQGDTAGTDVLFFAGVPVRDMLKGVELRQGELVTGVFVSDMNLRDRVTRRDSEAVRFAADDQFERRTSVARLDTGSYVYRFEAMVPEAERAARGTGRVTVDNLRGSGFAISDVVVADRVAPRDSGGVPRGRGDFFIAPNPAMKFRRTDQVHLYAELYGLAPRKAGEDVAQFQVWVRLRVDSLARRSVTARIVGGVLDAIGASAKGDDELTLSYVSQESLTGRDRVPLYLALDLAGAPAGRYDLTVTVKDLTTGQFASRHRGIEIAERLP